MHKLVGVNTVNIAMLYIHSKTQLYCDEVENKII